MAVTTEEFKQGMQRWASGVAVVTTQSQDGVPLGMTVTSFSSVSAEPAQILVCINQETATGDAIKAGGTFGVNILTREQEEISNLFASSASPEERYAKVEYLTTDQGTPLLTAALASFECRVVTIFDAGSHSIVVGGIEQIILRDGEPLCYFKADYQGLKGQP